MGSDSKGKIFFGKLDMSASFQKRLRETRKLFGIPQLGFRTIKKGDEWLWSLEDEGMAGLFKNDGRYEKYVNYGKAKEGLMNEFSIPPSFAAALDGKVLFANRVLKDTLPLSFGCVLLDPGDEERMHLFQPEQYWSRSRTSHATLLIHAGASRSDVISYIRRNWDRIQDLVSGSSSSKRIRKSTMQRRDEVIFEYCSMTREELGLKTGEYKTSKVKKLLATEQKIFESEGNIKRIYREQRSLQR